MSQVVPLVAKKTADEDVIENWKEAQSDFFESFRNYDEAGSLQRIQVLKYLVLTTMLMKSDINPFDSQETKPYVPFTCRSVTAVLSDVPADTRMILVSRS